MITVLPEVKDHVQLLYYFRDQLKIDVKLMVEVGVLRAEYSLEMLKCFPGMWVGIDPYVPFWEAPMPREEHLDQAVKNLKRFLQRYELFIDSDSHKLADSIVVKYGRPQLVYIDADHHYEPCKLDIEIWLSRITNGGVLAGHDYDEELLPGVFQAANELAETLEVFITNEKHWSSWFCVKE